MQFLSDPLIQHLKTFAGAFSAVQLNSLGQGIVDDGLKNIRVFSITLSWMMTMSLSKALKESNLMATDCSSTTGEVNPRIGLTDALGEGIAAEVGSTRTKFCGQANLACAVIEY
jgi:hypothetical protein